MGQNDKNKTGKQGTVKEAADVLVPADYRELFIGSGSNCR